MTAAATDLLETLRDAGFDVNARDGKVYVQPRERLTEADTAQVVKHKPQLLQLLNWERLTPCEGMNCRAHIDPQAVEDIGALCDIAWCPHKQQVRTTALPRKPR